MRYWLSVNDCIESLLLGSAVLFVLVVFFFLFLVIVLEYFFGWKKYSLETPYLHCLYFCPSTNGIALVKIGFASKLNCASPYEVADRNACFVIKALVFSQTKCPHMQVL